MFVAVFMEDNIRYVVATSATGEMEPSNSYTPFSGINISVMSEVKGTSQKDNVEFMNNNGEKSIIY